MSALITGSFTGTGQSNSKFIVRNFNVSILFGAAVGTVQLRRSFDDGSTWEVVASYTGDTATYVFEPELQVLYELNCSAYTSGTITYRIGGSGI